MPKQKGKRGKRGKKDKNASYDLEPKKLGKLG
jgi:hypothetical protein